MIVAAWFILVTLIILVGFALIGVTFWHWRQQAKLAREKSQLQNTAEV